MTSCSSSAIIPHQETKYDVFINFRGKDTRKTITSHLYRALCGKNIVTYKDDKNLKRGDEISPSLLTAIDRSKISVVIFSKSYASSRWCLDELVHILHCRKNGQFVIPIFYHVDPCHVRSRESYATDFAELGKRFESEKLKDWSSALTEAANLAGFHYPDNARTEADLVEKVVGDIWEKLKGIPSSGITSSYVKGLFGFEKRIYQIESLLCLDSPNTKRVIGIWGMGGIGKTTIAEILFNQYSPKFEASCFLRNVREELEKPGGMNFLERTLFWDLLNEENINIGTSCRRLKELQSKKVLIVFDDVNQIDQLHQIGRLVGDIEAFGYGTRFIFTSRDKQVLKISTEQDKIYHVEELNCFEARELFEFHAFKESTAPKDYQDLCSRVVNYANGIPLALKILGSTLHSKKPEQWEDALDKLKKYPNDEIQGVLKLSYDRLDFEEKRIFLDIACFFKGWYKDHVIRILRGCKFNVVSGVGNLIDRSLITIGNTIEMHDLIQQMGWDVVRNSGNQSRVWNPEDVCSMLQGNTGTEQVEGIFYETRRRVVDKSHVCQKRYLNKDSFSKMKNVRLVKISYPTAAWCCQCKLHLPDGLEALCFPSAPSLFHWDEYPLKSLPLNLDLSNLVELHTPRSQLERLWDGNQPLWNLRKIDCSGSEHLIEITDLSIAPNVEWLAFVDCINLAQLPHLQNLKSLHDLLLRGCSNLKRLPELPGNINCLDISETGIQKLPSSIEEAEKLTFLYLENVQGIKNLPTGIHKLKSLFSLEITGCSKLKQFPKILEPMENLDRLESCKMGIKTLPWSIMNLTGLTNLILCQCENLEFLPYSICNLSCLKVLDLSSCTKLEKLPPLPASLVLLYIRNCRNLKCLQSFPVYAMELDAYNCESLEYIPNLKTQLSHELWDQYLSIPSSRWWGAKVTCNQNWTFDNCICLSSDEKVCNGIIELSQFIIWRMASGINKESPFLHDAAISCPGNEIPKWFNHQIEGCSIHMDLPLHWLNSEFLGFALCIVANSKQNCKSLHDFDRDRDFYQYLPFKCKSHFKTNNNESYETDYCVGSKRSGLDQRKFNSNHLFMFYYYPLHLQKKISYSGSQEGYCPYPNSTKVSFTLYINAVRWGDPYECWSVKKFGIRMLYAPDAKELGFVDVAKVEIATKHKMKRDEPESSRSKSLCSVEI